MISFYIQTILTSVKFKFSSNKIYSNLKDLSDNDILMCIDFSGNFIVNYQVPLEIITLIPTDFDIIITSSSAFFFTKRETSLDV